MSDRTVYYPKLLALIQKQEDALSYKIRDSRQSKHCLQFEYRVMETCESLSKNLVFKESKITDEFSCCEMYI